jgi:hypothetical protein
MKLPFADWVSQLTLSTNVSALLDEAFICYRSSAYRASMHFSYLAFLTMIKELIMKSVKPTAVDQGRWDALLLKLQNDELWEKAVFTELTNSSNPIFNMPDDLRQQVKYWKDRRNDCAHFKSNNIDHYHTEAFWSFLKSNLFKMTLEGGKASLLNKFSRHFDLTYTPANIDYGHLVVAIDNSVPVTELTDFWKELADATDEFSWMLGDNGTHFQIFDKVFTSCSVHTATNLAEFLIKEESDLAFVYFYPAQIGQFRYTQDQVREIWQTKMWKDKSRALGIYGTLLRNGMIPTAELTEANKRVLSKTSDYAPNNEATHYALAENGFGEVIFQAVTSSKFDDWYNWVNPRADLIAYYIEKYPLRKEIVKVICEMYTRSRYSHWLGERLEKLFSLNGVKKAEFHKIANEQGYTIPSNLA